VRKLNARRWNVRRWEVRRPVALLGRGLAELARLAARGWAATPAERRLPLLAAVAAALVLVALLPRGPLWAALALLAAALVAGRRAARVPGAEAAAAAAEDESARLETVYQALVPRFCPPPDTAPATEPLYSYDGGWRRAFEEHAFHEGRLTLLRLRYPAFFPDGDPSARADVERLLRAKAGRDRELRLRWDEERNLLELTAPPPLPTGICAQRFVTAPGEMVLGFTDPGAVDRTVPVYDADGTTVDASPVVWRTGPHARAAHLLVAGGPGAGASSLLRSVALQALPHGDVLLLDGSGAGEFAAFAGRPGVLAVESGPAQAAAALEWAALETERRLAAASRARRAAGGAQGPRPLWIMLDRPAQLSHRAEAAGLPDPQRLLEVPLRHGGAGQVTVVLAEHPEGLAGLSAAAHSCTAARVALGALSAEVLTRLLGAEPGSTPPPRVPPGRGYARLAPGPVHRLQVPATPDPYDDAAGRRQRAAVLALLPDRPVSLVRRAAVAGSRADPDGQAVDVMAENAVRDVAGQPEPAVQPRNAAGGARRPVS
jgi:hypothetical protein